MSRYNGLMRALVVWMWVAACGKVETTPDVNSTSFVVTAGVDRLLLRQGGNTDLAISVTRGGVSGPITLAIDGAPSGVTAAEVVLGADETAGMLTVVADASAVQGRGTFSVRATAGAMTATSFPLPLLVAGAPGTLDQSFATGGKLVPTLNNMALGSRDLVISPAGIVVTGFVFTAPFQAITVRVLDDGSLDPTFGTNGFVSTGSGPGAEGIAVAMQGDSILIAGIAGGASASDLDMGVIRYTPTGQLDSGFAAAGVATFNPGVGIGELHTLAVSTTSDIFAAGTLFGSSLTGHALHLLPTGQLDTTFAITEPNALIEASLLQADNKYVLAGGKANDMWIARYTAAGARDPAFGTNGETVVDFGDNVNAFAMLELAGGKFLLAGSCVVGGAKRMCLAQFNGNGSLDATFGNGGKLNPGAAFDVRTMTRSGDKYLIAGAIGSLPAVARLNADGSFDRTFGTGSGGFVTVDFGVAGTTAQTTAFGVGVDADDRIVIGCDVGGAGSQRMAIARIWQ